MPRFIVPIFYDSEDRETVPQEGDVIRYDPEQGVYGLLRDGILLRCKTPTSNQTWVWTPDTLTVEEPIMVIARASAVRYTRMAADGRGRPQWLLG